MTPRKPRQRQHHPHNSQSHPLNQVQVSDYESEPFYVQPMPTRSNTELNLSVLQRYLPTIHSILAISAAAQIYTFDHNDGTWEKNAIEGTLFVCQLQSSNVPDAEQFCLVVLNRKGLDNLIIEMGEIHLVEITDEILILRLKARGAEDPKTLGLFMAADKADTKEVNCRLIKECWEQTERSMGESHEAHVENYGEGLQTDQAGNGVPMGRRLSLKDLFGQHGLQ